LSGKRGQGAEGGRSVACGRGCQERAGAGTLMNGCRMPRFQERRRCAYWK